MVLTYAEWIPIQQRVLHYAGNVAGPFFVKAKSSFSLDNENANVFLICLTRDNNSVLPVRLVKLMVLEQTLLKYIVTHNSYGAPGCSPSL